MDRISILQVNDKLSMDGVNPSSCAALLGDWHDNLDPGQFLYRVCTLRNPDPGGEYLEERGVHVDYLGHGKLSPANVGSITRLIDQYQTDIVHMHGYSASNFGRIAARRKRIPGVVHEHAVLRVQPHQYLADRLLRRYTDRAIAVSRPVRDFMVKGRCIPADRIAVIGNGISLVRYRKDPDADSVRAKRRKLGIADSTKIVGTVTRLREEQGNEYLLRAIPGILEQAGNVLFLLAGEGPLRRYLERLAGDLGIRDRVRFLGHRDDVPELLTVFDINVLASLSEGFGLSLVEAMATENTIVATAVGGMQEIGRHGETVMFVPPADPGAIRDRVVELLQNEELATRLAANAGRASREYGIENSVGRLAAFYRELV